jgi:aminoglycoside phosphotransferase family enzyme
MHTDDQTAVLDLLASPSTHGGSVPERIDTHISAVFLVGDKAYKLKKAVRLPFLDFSTAALRRAACEAEYAINRRAAPDLYLGVIPVLRTEAGLALGALGGDGAGGEEIDTVVVMRRFADEARLDRVLEAGGIDRPLVRALTEAVTRFHRAAPVRTDRGGSAAFAWLIANNADTMAPFCPDPLPGALVASLADRSRAWLERLAPLLDRRREQGMVRECHGDLHLANICLMDGRPVLFDAIEFSETLSCVDTAYDFAFLLMDLDVRGARPVASMAMNHALDLEGDYAAMAAMPLFLSLRAGVRAMVSASVAEGLTGDAQARKRVEARCYLDAALAYLEPPPPRLVAIGGLSGSGKSRMGRVLAPLLGVPGAAVVRSDALRKRLMGVGLVDRLGPEGYRPEVGRRTYDRLYETCTEILAGGGTVIADAVFADPGERDAIEQVAIRAGVPFTGLWLEVSPEVAAARVAKRGADGADASDATVAVLERQQSYELGDIAWSRLDTGAPDEAAAVGARALLGV